VNDRCAPGRYDREVLGRILVVDDEPLNRHLLRACFGGSGHEICEAHDGQEALVVAEDKPPDLVLMDVMMPGMDGFECTRQMKEMFADTYLPIIVVTALDDRASRVAGLAAGADEFLSKPIDRDELLMRAGNLLDLRAREVELSRRNVELVELRRFQDDTMAMLVHDLKSPLSVIQASVDYLLGNEELAGETREAVEDCRQSTTRIARLVGNILEIAHAEAGRLVLKPSKVSLGPVIAPLLDPRRSVLARRSITVETELGAAAMLADRDLLARVIENLIDNAARHTPTGGRMRLWAQPGELRIGNSGAPIPPPMRTLVFEKYTQVCDAGRPGGGNVGLGLYFCRLAVEAHGGRIWIEETPELPTVFAMQLPEAA